MKGQAFTVSCAEPIKGNAAVDSTAVVSIHIAPALLGGYGVHGRVQLSAPGRVKQTIRDFARRIDALLELLDSTGDALAATRDTIEETQEFAAENKFERPIQ
jgi:hypothetical protein